MSFRAVLFDLDGTLLDTLEDLACAMNAALARHGHPEHPLAAFREFVGDGVHAFAERALPNAARTPDTIQVVADFAMEAYAACWREHTRPYPGVPALLEALSARELRVGVLSNKPHRFTVATTEALLAPFVFDLVWGVGSDVPKKPDPTGALRAAAALGIPPSEFLYCGDTNTDMATAVAAGMFPAGALWGFRDAEELVGAGARVLLPTPLDLLHLV